jgi:hypothetical protein
MGILLVVIALCGVCCLHSIQTHDKLPVCTTHTKHTLNTLNTLHIRSTTRNTFQYRFLFLIELISTETWPNIASQRIQLNINCVPFSSPLCELFYFPIIIISENWKKDAFAIKLRKFIFRVTCHILRSKELFRSWVVSSGGKRRERERERGRVLIFNNECFCFESSYLQQICCWLIDDNQSLVHHSLFFFWEKLKIGLFSIFCVGVSWDLLFC